ncbi:hypothetical protein PIB30_040805 [Stylosanthes scabra]|uniref:Uncharacterized protein n=1 Tax=Stylosanthes scabra TaxID=79078 RepID=A0ABU6SFK7_9FABA|nr:hypothetical protein [Stylosanthes scabra]
MRDLSFGSFDNLSHFLVLLMAEAKGFFIRVLGVIVGWIWVGGIEVVGWNFNALVDYHATLGVVVGIGGFVGVYHSSYGRMQRHYLLAIVDIHPCNGNYTNKFHNAWVELVVVVSFERGESRVWE